MHQVNWWIELGLRICVGCSIAHNFLPPWDFLDDLPTAQKYYKALVYIIGYIALNGRSTVYRSISTSNPEGPNANQVTLDSSPVIVKP